LMPNDWFCIDRSIRVLSGTPMRSQLNSAFLWVSQFCCTIIELIFYLFQYQLCFFANLFKMIPVLQFFLP
jgi:hypothetical protein